MDNISNIQTLSIKWFQDVQILQLWLIVYISTLFFFFLNA